MRITVFPCVLAFTILANAALADLTPQENAARLKQIDRNADGVLENDEVDLGLYYRATGGKFDLKFPPSSAQVAAFAATNAVFQLLRYEFVTDHGTKEEYAFSEVKADIDFRLPKAEKPQTDSLPGGTIPSSDRPNGKFILRQSLDKAPLLFDTDKSGSTMTQGADKLAGEGALFSYGQAFNNGAEEWLAQGLFGYEADFEGGLFGKTSIGRWLFSLGFSRIDFGGSGTPKTSSPRFKNEDNLATLGVTYEGLLNWPQGVWGFTGSSLRVNVLWKSDWDFQSQIPTAEVDWSFYNGRWGLGSFNTTCKYLWYRIDPTIHADVGYVLEDGKWTKSKEGDTFAHVGPKIGLALMPFPNAVILKDNPIVLNVSFSEFIDLTKQSLETRAFSADLSWYIRKPGSGKIGPVDPGIALTLAFRNYRNVENQTDDNSLLLGIAMGF